MITWNGLRVLVISPTPTHPQDHGNRKRVWAVCKALKEKGASIHFLHYPSEHDWRSSRPLRWEREMRAAWDGYDLVPPSRPLHTSSLGDDHRIDEWADPSLSNHVAWLFNVQSFDIAIVNYTWMSFCLEAIPDNVLKICDAHDVFSHRRLLLEANGIAPEFFHTTQDEEARGLKRADLVWAIKASERNYFLSELGIDGCIVLIHAEDVASAPRPRRADGWLRAGVIGAKNNINARNLQNFLDAALPLTRAYMAPIKFVVAGGLSDDFSRFCHPNVEVLGRVEHSAEFYARIDVVFVPMEFSTGLKIKVSEAFAAGMPLVAHAHATDGYPTDEGQHRHPSFKDMAKALIHLSFDVPRLERLAEASREVAARVREEVDAAYDETRAWLGRKDARVLLVIAAAPALAPGTLQYDHLYSVLEYARLIGPIAVYVTGALDSTSCDSLCDLDRNIRLFREEPGLSNYQSPADAKWTNISLGELLSSRGYRRLYVMTDCGQELADYAGRVHDIFIRADVVAVEGGDVHNLIDQCRALAVVHVLSTSTRYLARWNDVVGIRQVLRAPIRRVGEAVAMATRPSRGPVSPLVVIGSGDDPIVWGLSHLASRLGVRAEVIDPSREISSRGDGCSLRNHVDRHLSLLAAAHLVVDVSPEAPVTEIYHEILQRGGRPVLRVVRERRGSCSVGSALMISRPPASALLRTVAAILRDEDLLKRVSEECRHEIESAAGADAGWTSLWAVLSSSSAEPTDAPAPAPAPTGPSQS